jgi:protein O-mannosyl-transferase
LVRLTSKVWLVNIRPTGLRKFWVALAGVLLLTWCVYRPGLSGGFLFDDFINLNALGSSGPIDNWASFWRYLTSGTADPTGRPIALLSFLIDARDWPADPRHFLRTNLIIHMINGALLYALLRFLGRALGDESETKLTAAPLLAAALWLMHPLFVSTTLYAVQREAMLPATFVLLGLITYSRGRVSFATTEAQRGLMLMWVGICLGTMLALLCKANGMLLPLLAWVLEATVFCGLPKLRAGSEAARSLFRAKLWLLWVPSGAVLVYLSHFLADWTSTPAGRAWTIGQRVLTEPRILLDYLQLLLVPRSVSSGLFNDNYQASHGLFQPATTVLSLLMVIACLLLALRYRAKFPALAGAVLFFFAGQALESSSVPLELYFEHRARCLCVERRADDTWSGWVVSGRNRCHYYGPAHPNVGASRSARYAMGYAQC